jgi:hypothetical protein
MKLNKNELDALQLSRRGGSLKCVLDGNRVKIAGQAKTYLIGNIKLDYLSRRTTGKLQVV